MSATFYIPQGPDWPRTLRYILSNANPGDTIHCASAEQYQAMLKFADKFPTLAAGLKITAGEVFEHTARIA